MQNNNFKEIFALCEEIYDLTARFKRFVDDISYAEEKAGNLERELSGLLQQLQDILSDNGHSLPRTGVASNIGKGLIDPDRNFTGQREPPAGSAPTPSSLKRQMVAFHKSFKDMAKHYNDLAGRINSIDGSASNLRLVLMRIQETLKSLIKKYRLLSEKAGLISVPSNADGIPEHTVGVLAWSAEIGVSSFGFQRLSNGKAVFEIEGKHLTLSPRSADLLIVLSGNHGPSENGLVGWKTMEELEQSVLGPKFGWPPKDAADQERLQHIILVSILRLRDSFSNAGMNRYLIQKNPRFGYRFALKRRDYSGDAVNPP